MARNLKADKMTQFNSASQTDKTRPQQRPVPQNAKQKLSTLIRCPEHLFSTDAREMSRLAARA